MLQLDAVNVLVHQTKEAKATAKKVQTQIIDCENLTVLENKDAKCDICVAQRTTYFQTLFHLIKCHIGSGIFAVGDVFRNHTGLLLGPLLTICLGIVCICDNHVLANCSKEVKQRQHLSFYPTFPETVEWAFQSGPSAFRRCSAAIREVVKGLNLMTQLGCCIVYFIFTSSSLQSLLRMLARHGIVIDEHLIIVIIFFPVVLTIFMANLRFLTLFSVLSSMFVFSAVALTLYVSSSDLPPITSRPTIAHWSQIPLFFGTSIYCFEGIAKTWPLNGETPPIMAPLRHCNLLIVLLALVGMLFVVIAFICFIKFVDDVASHHLSYSLSQTYLCSEVVHLTIALGLLFSYTLQFHIALMLVWPELIMEHGPVQHTVLAELALRLIIALATCEYLFFSYMLQFHIALMLVWPELIMEHGPVQHTVLVELALRLIIALATFAAVEVVPCLGVFVSLTGAVCGCLLALMLPPLCDLALYWPRHSRPWKHSFDFFSILIAIAGLVTGVLYTAVVMIKGFPDELPPHQ